MRGSSREQTETNIASASTRQKQQKMDWRKQCLQGINNMGLEHAWRVGGDVRDELMQKEDSKDMDIVVVGETYETLIEKAMQAGQSTPLESNGQQIGVRLFAPWTPKEGVEIALARTEKSTGEGHKDFEISPIDIEEYKKLQKKGMSKQQAANKLLLTDLNRRDFTVNAIASNTITGEIFDPYNGFEAIKNKQLEVLTKDSFRDDPLRILRGIARISKDDLNPTENTLNLMKEWAPAIKHLSQERLSEELQKTLKGKNIIKALKTAKETGVLKEWIPELASTINFNQQSKYHDLTTDEHIFQVVNQAIEKNAPIEVVLAALMHDSGKPESAFKGKDGNLHFYNNEEDETQQAHEIIGAQKTRQLIERLRMTTDEYSKVPQLSKHVSYLVENHMFRETESFADLKETKQRLKARRFIAEHIKQDDKMIDNLITLRYCDWAGKNKQGKISEENLKHLKTFEKIVKEERNNKQNAFTIKDLPVKGEDLQKAGLQGKEIGEALQILLHGSQGNRNCHPFAGAVDNPDMNNKEKMLQWIENQAKYVQKNKK